MKKKILKSTVAGFALATLFGINTYAAGEEPKNENSYYKKDNAPIIYGTIGIEIPKYENFDVKNSLYRVFAKDFEDGDLTSKIQIDGEDLVDTSKPGTYYISYTVTDSHNNTKTIKVPVKVTDKEDTNIKIQRKLYANKKNEAANAVGMYRGDHHDRQHLGLNLFDGSKVKVTYVEGNADLTIQNETQKFKDEPVTYKTIKKGESIELTSSYNATPFVRTPIGNELEPTVIELEILDDEITKSLALFYKGDDCTNFIFDWRENGGYGVFESESVTVMVGYNDLDNVLNPKGSNFETDFNEFLTWWDQVIDFFDASVGLEINPENLWDQNVRSKYFVAGHKGAGGSAYYGINQVGVSNGSAVSFFQYNWGGLHEVAHGYQGGLKSGINLSEVSNNILGWFTQYNAMYTDHFGERKQFLHGLRNGTLDKKEESVINSGKKWADFAKTSEGVNDHLYIMINLLDSFEGEKTWAKINSWYRKHKATSMPNYDVFAKAIAEEYKVNIVPYYDAFGIPISENVRTSLFEEELPLVQMAKYIVGDKTNDLKSQNVLKYDYQIIKNNKIDSLKLTGDLTVTAQIDTPTLIEGKDAVLYNGKTEVKRAQVKNGVVTFTDVPVGIYEIVMPQPQAAYGSDYAHVVVKAQENTMNYAYTKLDGKPYDNRIWLSVTGVHGTNGIKITNNGDGTVTITPGQARLSYEKAGKIAEVKIVNKQGQETSIAKAVDYDHFVFEEEFKTTSTIKVDSGSKIVIYHTQPQSRVKVGSTLTNGLVDELLTKEKETTYYITDNGFKLADMSDSEYQSIVYNIQKNEAVKQIDEYLSKVTTEELKQREKNLVEKSKVLNAILSLKEEERTSQYKDLYNKIVHGGDYGVAAENIQVIIKAIEDTLKLPDVDITKISHIYMLKPHKEGFEGTETDEFIINTVNQKLENKISGTFMLELRNEPDSTTKVYDNVEDLLKNNLSIIYRESEDKSYYQYYLGQIAEY